MTVDPQIFAAGAAVAVAWSGFLVGLVKWQLRGIEKRFDALEASIGEESKAINRVKEDLLTLKADLPVSYVRREDWIRNETITNAKLDAIWREISNLKAEKADE